MKSLFSTVALAFVAVAAFAQQTAEYNIKGTCAADVKRYISSIRWRVATRLYAIALQ